MAKFSAVTFWGYLKISKILHMPHKQAFVSMSYTLPNK